MIPVDVDFSLHMIDENLTSPLSITVINLTKNADVYYWTFENGDPATSSKKDPGTIIFTSPGEHKISLEAWNSGDHKAKSSLIHVDSIVRLDFSSEVEINNYAPAQIHIINRSSGGSNYRWIFEGGDPATYEGFSPPSITYHQKGNYDIILIANNGSADFILRKNIEILDSLNATFAIIPSFEDIDDMEAPFRARLKADLQGVESILWKCDNAVITNETSPDADLFINEAGTYTVYLNISNGKQEKTVSSEIIVKPNTNLRSHNDIRFGINTAQESIGSVYSTLLRRNFKSSEINASNGPFIDIAFLGLNATFVYNRFISPDNLFDTPLTPVIGAKTTKFINLQEQRSPVQLTVEQFNTMTTDIYLKELDLTIVDTANDYFSSSSLPRIVLFETADGRKGAILVKEIVKNGLENSYILTDIKIQKND